MILDCLDNLRHYGKLPYGILAAIEYLQRTDFTQVPDGRHELDGDRLVAIVQRYRPRPPGEALWEAHHRYVDVQCVIEGAERMGHLPWREGLAVKQPYDAEKDVVFFDVQGSFFHVGPGDVAIFLSHDIHAPGLAGDGTTPEVRKVVVKCRIA